MPVAAVVFDLDYTLAVPDRERQALLDEATAMADAPSISRAEYLDAHRRHLSNETREPIFADLLGACETDVSPDRLTTAYRSAIEGALRPVPGVEAFVRELRDTYRVGLLTDGPVDAQRGKLDTLGWGDLFDAVVVTGSLPAGKPDGRTFATILDALDVPPETAVYVGDDTDADVIGASEAGLRVVHVLGREREACPRADAVIDRVDLTDRLSAELAALE
jgi:putative hydrolase of the HAD superfamily